MMQENDDQASKEMLNTALQNGRQLVLSEGGRMLLHETKAGLSGKREYANGGVRKVPGVALRPNVNNSPPQKIRMNVIKQKEQPSTSPAGVSKNKVGIICSLLSIRSHLILSFRAEYTHNLVD